MRGQQNTTFSFHYAFTSLERAILATLHYAHLFDYPLTLLELHRYLIGVHATVDEVHHCLSMSRYLSQKLVSRNGFYVLRDSEGLIEIREERWRNAQILWRYACAYAEKMAQLPYVRMIALSGALAMGNETQSDIDFFIVTEPGRLWIARAWILLLVRHGRLKGIELCPNYLISLEAMRLPARNLYSAHELAQLVPLFGLDIYWRLRWLNRWTETFLPNATGLPQLFPYTSIPEKPRFAKQLAEWILNKEFGNWLERWELKRKQNKFARFDVNGETRFDAHVCKGHFGGYQQKTLQAFYDRLSLEKLSFFQ